MEVVDARTAGYIWLLELWHRLEGPRALRAATGARRFTREYMEWVLSALVAKRAVATMAKQSGVGIDAREGLEMAQIGEPPDAEAVVIMSWRDFEDRLPSLAVELDADPALALGAAANPLKALTELDVEIAPEARFAVESHLRFADEDTRARLERLRDEVFERCGRTFDLDSAEELAHVLFTELGLPGPPVDTQPLPAQPPSIEEKASPADPIEALRGQHPVIDPLLAYRRLEVSTPRFASEEIYRGVREGLLEHPLTRVRWLERGAPER